MNDLKLIAMDAEDLGVISAHLQDAVLKVGDLAYLPKEHRLAAIANRFDWLSAGAAMSDGKPIDKSKLQRRRTAIRFERVLSAQVAGIKLDAKRDVLSLLAIQFEETDAPAGRITMHFSGGGAIRMLVECIEVELRDLGGAWRAKSMPTHPDDQA